MSELFFSLVDFVFVGIIFFLTIGSYFWSAGKNIGERMKIWNRVFMINFFLLLLRVFSTLFSFGETYLFVFFIVILPALLIGTISSLIICRGSNIVRKIVLDILLIALVLFILVAAIFISTLIRN